MLGNRLRLTAQVYIAGAGPVGLAAAASGQLLVRTTPGHNGHSLPYGILVIYDFAADVREAIADLVQGAAVVIVADLIPERLAQAASFGCATVNVASSTPVSTQVHRHVWFGCMSVRAA